MPTTGTKVKLAYRGDTLVFNASAFNVPDGSMLDALIRQMPGAEMKSNGDIYVNGKKIDYLLLNGKDFFKGKNQVMLDNLPYYTVKELKVYDRSSEKSRLMGKEMEKKFYVLNMFPYTSGAGLHVGHPLGYIASDIYARYKRLNGFNVLNPMGYDAYGLPAEQYAIQTGQHPEVTTVANINRYREQLDKIGFCFDWDREVRTCDPKYYHWTQWAFQKMFNSFFCNSCQKAQPIEKLIKHFEEKGSADLNVAQNEQIDFTAEEWNSFDDVKKQQILMNYRIAYLGETMVNWCPGLGTVLGEGVVTAIVSWHSHDGTCTISCQYIF